MIRNLVKNGIEQALSSNSVARLVRHRVRDRRLILAYHGIMPDGAGPGGERSLFVSRRDFAEQLDFLADAFDVVPLHQIDAGQASRPRVAITMDDAYRGAVIDGVRELGLRGMPATIFVAPGRLNDHVFWWDSLAHGQLALDARVRHYALHTLSGSDERVRAWAFRERLPAADLLPDYARTATRAELHEAVRAPGITVGSHTWSHANLASLTVSELQREMEQSMGWVRAEFGDKAVPWLAYPYGLDSEAVQRAAAAAHYAGAVRIGGGWHKATEVGPFARPRFNIPAGLTISGFRARLTGALPL